MSLAVLSVSYPLAPVGPHAVGGAEQILTELDRALVAAGHTSLVLACEGSQTAGELFTFSSNFELPREQQNARLQSALDKILISHRVDLVHMHSFDFHRCSVPSGIPELVTLHLPISWYPPNIWVTLPGNIHLQCVSQSQRRSCPPQLGDLPVVVNGVALPDFPMIERKSDFALVLGRICPEKNQHAALEAGSLAGIEVLLGGRIYPYTEHELYFSESIQPLLQRPHQFLGPLSPERKHRLLSQAKCLLHPTLAPETSSLVVMEALAAGTPVIAYPSGALPEIIDDGVTGFLVSSVEEMAAAISRVHTIRSETCRDVAERRFSRERMARDYMRLYQELIETPADIPDQEPLHA